MTAGQQRYTGRSAVILRLGRAACPCHALHCTGQRDRAKQLMDTAVGRARGHRGCFRGDRRGRLLPRQAATSAERPVTINALTSLAE